MPMCSMTPIAKYLKQTGLSRNDLMTLLEKQGWRPDASTLCRWISGERCPSPSARAMLERVSGGKIVYG